MAEIHSLDIPVSKEPDWLWNTMKRWIQNVDTILANIKNTTDNINNNDENANSNEENEIVDKIKKINFRHEMEWLKDMIEKNEFPVVFSHNDLQEGNILLKENDFIVNDNYNAEIFDNYDDTTLNDNLSSILITSKENDITQSNNDYSNSNININNINNSRKRSLDDYNYKMNDCDSLSKDSSLDNSNDSIMRNIMKSCDPELMIIDFEYCAYNYRGFDLANHFLEWTFDYTNENFPFYHYKKEQYPTIEQQVSLIN